jgi:hypothetical protein
VASPGTLVRGMAELLGMSQVYVGAFDRELAKNELRAKHGRGSSAASMTAIDATNLLIAIMSGAQAKDAAQAVQLYSGLRGTLQSTFQRFDSKVINFFDYRGRIDSGALKLALVDSLSIGHTLFDFIFAMIESAESGELERALGQRKEVSASALPGEANTWGLSIRVSGPLPSAQISLECDGIGSGCYYSGPEKDPLMGDLKKEMSISGATIIGIGRILRE